MLQEKRASMAEIHVEEHSSPIMANQSGANWKEPTPKPAARAGPGKGK